MSDLGPRPADAAVVRRVALTAERLLLVAGLISTIVLLLAVF